MARTELNSNHHESSPCFAVAAILVAALYASAFLLADFFNQKWRLARWTGFGYGTIPKGKFTFGIITTREKRAAFARSLLDEIAAAVGLRTFDAKSKRFGRLTLRIA